MTREVVTRENHEHIEHLNEAVAGTIRAYAIPQERERLVGALELQFERLAERMAGVGRGALEEFADELIEVAVSARKLGAMCTSVLESDQCALRREFGHWGGN